MEKRDKWDAENYRKNSSSQFEGAMSFVNKYKFKGNEAILDVGCGDGRISAEIAKKVPQGFVVGVDVSTSMINLAKKSFSNVKNLEFIQEDISKFCSDKKLDLVCSFSTFHWVKDKLNALKNIYKMLKPQGELFIFTTVKNDKSEIARVSSSPKWKSQIKESYFHAISAEDAKKLLETVGFKNFEVKTEIREVIYNSKEDLFDWMKVWIPHSVDLHSEKIEEYMNDIVEEYCKGKDLSKGKINRRNFVMKIYAKKD
ncbi:TPA: hypothetical protein DEO28_02230 [Candidatus Dependentiae bacterium]|nr:MAG: Trans-aconitate 2-methyltransferase [candidate division TM6 bacterium GW2011_GWE2_31_21]KKP52552.1 MAG: Trans-aconitate 2-methyltransferase [candidate division TM6 bacterium GW2011_GWF2_33_332]HBS48458.1 hypothetical protein [Candidatus Dependentiae bacterium]HBZ73307.1 hypothetical protein [Candidatus Dependentiae bacterium]